ncbi:MAG: PD-(D/E)XK nuclease family protein, partial [Thermanaerothrix sp.]|nr:PD-(D/E)XK nuclease family protein [Thermanaerothrix sp.]
CGEAANSGWEFFPAMRLVSSVLDLDMEALMTRRPRGLDQWRDFVRSQHGEEWERKLLKLAEFGQLLLKGATPKRLLEEALGVMKLADPERISRAVGDRHDLDWTVRGVTSAIEEMEKKLFSLSEEVENLGPAFQEPLKLRDAMGFLKAWGNSSYTAQDQPLEGAVRIYRDAPPVLAEHGLFVLCGTDQSRWPGKLNESPLMDEASRHRVNNSFLERSDLTPTHLVDLHERRKAREALFIRMALAGREAFVMTQGAEDRDGRPSSPTPFEKSLLSMGAKVEELNGSPSLFHSESFVRGVEFPARAADDASRALGGPYKVNVSIKNLEAKPSLPLSGIDSFVKCPFRFACERILKLRAPEVDPVPHYLMGSLAHEAMEIAVTNPGISHEDLMREVLKLPSAGPILEPGRERYQMELDQMICRGVSWLRERRSELEAKGLRLAATLTEVPLPKVEMENYTGTGRADLVDVIEGPEGRGYVILDFKTGGTHRYEDSLQLAAYARALKGGPLEEPSALRGAELWGFGFVSLRDMLGRSRWEIWGSREAPVKFNKSNRIGVMWTSGGSRFDAGGVAQAYGLYQPKGSNKGKSGQDEDGTGDGNSAEDVILRASKALEDLDRALGTGEFRANHTDDNVRKHVCPTCPYGGVCRRLEAWDFEEEEDEGGEWDDQ